MNIFKLKSKSNQLFFTNYERLDEEVVFNQILDILKSDSSVVIGEKIIGPPEDAYECNIFNNEFVLK